MRSSNFVASEKTKQKNNIKVREKSVNIRIISRVKVTLRHYIQSEGDIKTLYPE